MTYREAIESFQMDECADCYAPIEECRRCPVGLAIESLEKQISKKPEYKKGRGLWSDVEAHCPNCDDNFNGNEHEYPHNYCSFCGQAIDWSDKDDK